MPTIRQQMIDLLSREAWGARDLSRALGISEKEVYDHLPHIQRTVTSGGRRFQVAPAACLSCGYIFNKRSRLTRPGRCVRCKGERISEPLFQISMAGHCDGRIGG
ncbi:MAG: transcriptional regulator [Thermodesulfobacteriota bacterium]